MAAATRPDVFIKLDTGTHTSSIVQLIVTPDGRRLISAGECTIRVWNAQTREQQALLLSQVYGRYEENYGPGDVLRMALWPGDGRSLVVLVQGDGQPPSRSRRRSGNQVQVFDIETGNLRARFLHEGRPMDLDFSADGRYLALMGEKSRLQIYAAGDVLKAGFDRPPRARAELGCVQPPRGRTLSAAVRFVPAIRSRAEPYALVVALNAAPHPAQDGDGLLQWLLFDPAAGFKRLRAERTEAGIRPGTLSANEDWAVVGAAGLASEGSAKVGQLFAHRHTGPQPDQAAGSHCTRVLIEAPAATTAFSPSGLRLLVGTAADLYSSEGHDVLPAHSFTVSVQGFELRSSYHRHDDSVQALAFLGDDQVVSAGGDNQSIHIWDSRSLVGQTQAAIRGYGRTVTLAHVNKKQQVLFSMLPPLQLPAPPLGRLRSFCLRTLQLSTSELRDLSPTPDMDGMRKGRWIVIDITGHSQLVPIRFGATAWGPDLDRPPDLTLFVGSDDEWVLWTRSGYYVASPLGGRRLGYHVNRGTDQEALFLASDRFKNFHRPDIVRAVIEHGTEDLARKAGVRIDPLDPAASLPPVIELQSAEPVAGQDAVRLRFTVQPLNPGGAVSSVWLLRNGRTDWSTRLPGPTRQRQFDVTRPLGPGRNVFTLLANNASGRAEVIEREFQGPAAAQGGAVAVGAPGHLHLLSVGVSNFQAAGTPQAVKFDVKPLRCAHRDAIAVYNALACSVEADDYDPRRPQQNAAFEDVHALLLVDEQATKAAIRQALHGLSQRIQARSRAAGAERDVLVLFLAGHGIQMVGDPNLYFLNHDTDFNREETQLTLQEIGELLATVPAEVVVLIDTCHSGMAGSSIDRGVGPDEVARRLQEDSERSMVVLSAARADEKAREGNEQQHGVFTYALLATLGSRRYLQPDPDIRTVSLSLAGLMQGLQAEAPRYTRMLGTHDQTPVIRTFGNVLPLTIYRRRRMLVMRRPFL